MKPFLQTLFFFFLFTHLQYPQTGWFWQNPLPQGNMLYDVDESAGLKVSVGTYGTILTNNGSGWQVRDGESKNTLFSVIIKGNNIWASGEEGTMLHCSDGNGIVWESQTTGVDKQLRSVFFLNENLGWSVGELETVLKTTDGGSTWQILRSNGTQHFFEVFFHNENNGWLAGASGSYGTVKYTTNGGTTWLNKFTPTSRMMSIHFADASFGCTVGDGGRIFRTTDGGANWTLAVSNTTKDLRGVYLITDGTGWAVGNDGTIIRTTDWGENWNYQLSGISDNLNSVHKDWIVGWAGVILHSTDSGTNWQKSFTGFTSWITGIDFVTELIGYASGQNGRVYRTFNGGESWEELYIGASLNLNDVDFWKYYDLTGSGAVVGEANGAYYTVFRTTDNGTTWLNRSFSIPQSYPATDLTECYRMQNTNFVVGMTGIIARTKDGGSSWDIQNNPFQSYDLFAIDFESENVGWAAGSSGTVLKTTDNGENWFNVNPDNVSNFKSIYFPDLRNGFVVGVGGVIYRTTDGGYDWTKVTPNVTSETLFSVYFIDKNVGWAAGQMGTILHTTNGGVDWYHQESGTNNLLHDISFTETGIGWICGWYGTIIHTTDGGGGLSLHSFWQNNLNITLADPGESSIDMNVIVNPGHLNKNLNSNIISGLTVVLDTIFHTNISDLIILLEHLGVTDTLVMQPINSGSDFINCALTDASSVLVDEAEAPFTGIYKPHSSLSVFAGMDPNGIWTLKILDLVSGNTGTLEAWGLKLYLDAATNIESDYKTIPKEYKVYQNFPNPFNPSTTIKWQIPKAVFVTLKIYDVLGREVTTLVNEEVSAGKHESVFDANRFSSGVYFYQIKAGEFIQTRKMLLLK